MHPSELLTAVINTERQRDAERRNRDWRLLHPDLEDVPASTTAIVAELTPRPVARAPRPAAGSCEPVV